MASALDKQSGFEGDAQHASSWHAAAMAEAYAARKPEESASVGNFAKDHWKEIAGVGLAVVAGTAFVVAGRRLGPFASLLRGSETAAGLAESGEGASAELLARLRNVDHFVFDMDRTLVDHDRAFAVLNKTMTDGLVRESGLSHQFITDALKQTTERLDSPYFWNRLDEIRPLQKAFPGVNLNQRFGMVADNARTAYYDALKAKPETLQLLDDLRSQGKGVHVFTAGNPARALTKLEGAGLLGRLDSIYTSGTNAFEDSAASGLMTRETSKVPMIALEKTAKADGSGYQAILDHLDTKGPRVAMTGDHPVEDIANSHAHGYFTSQATWYRNSPIAGVAPDLRLSSPAQLSAMLRSAELPK